MNTEGAHCILGSQQQQETVVRDTKFDIAEATPNFSNPRLAKFHKTFGHSRTCRPSVIPWPTPVPYTSTREGERKTRSRSHTRLNEILFWKVTPHKKQRWFSADSLWGLVPPSLQGCSTSQEPSSAAGWLCCTHSANNWQMPRTQTADRLCSPTRNCTAAEFLLHIFLSVPALQGSSPSSEGSPAEMQ